MQYTEKDVVELMKKLPPITRDTKLVHLPLVFFTKLSDVEFTVLWHMPKLEIHVSKKAMEYIDRRRRVLKLTHTKDASILQKASDLKR